MTIYLIIQLNIKFAIYFTDQERLLFLEIYYQLYDLALQSQEIIDNPDWDIDNWEIDVKIILILLTCYSQGNPNNLKYVLWESPQVRKIKLASPKLEYKQQIFNYMNLIYKWAEKLFLSRNDKRNIIFNN